MKKGRGRTVQKDEREMSSARVVRGELPGRIPPGTYMNAFMSVVFCFGAASLLWSAAEVAVAVGIRQKLPGAEMILGDMALAVMFGTGQTLVLMGLSNARIFLVWFLRVLVACALLMPLAVFVKRGPVHWWVMPISIGALSLAHVMIRSRQFSAWTMFFEQKRLDRGRQDAVYDVLQKRR